jgi:hypothetical protein
VSNKSVYLAKFYKTVAGAPGSESVFERDNRERFWRSIRKQVEKGR